MAAGAAGPMPLGILGDDLAYLNPRVHVSPLAFNAKGDGSTDDTAAINAAITFCAALSHGGVVDLGSYIWTVDGVVLKSRVRLAGSAQGNATLLRKPNATGRTVVSGSSLIDVSLVNITINGNKAGQTVNATGLLLNGCAAVHLDRVEATSCLGLDGITVAGLTDSIYTETSSLFGHVVASRNDGAGLRFVGSSWRLKVRDGEFHGNGASGLSLTSSYPPADRTNLGLEITGNQATHNSGTGIGLQGFITGVNGSAPIYGVGTEPYTNVLIERNQCLYNGKYGLVAQVRNGVVVGNICSNNGGTGKTYAGILANAEFSVFRDNICEQNEFYGIDAGGGYFCDFISNRTGYNGYQSTSGTGVGLNTGASRFTSYAGNVSYYNGGSTAGAQFYCQAYDGTGKAFFPWLTTNVGFQNNRAYCNNANQHGFHLKQGPQNVTFLGNRCIGAKEYYSFALECVSWVEIHDNVSDRCPKQHSMTSATAFVTIADEAEDIVIKSVMGGTISALWPYFLSVNQNTVWAAQITMSGMGYGTDPSQIMATIAGGGGSGATAQVLPDGAGGVGGILITNKGSGYTSAPTVTITGPFGSSGATAVALYSPTATLNNRKLRVGFESTMIVNSTSNLRLEKATAMSAVANSVLRLDGWLGQWFEAGRFDPS